jgi:hypothetical protein
VRHLSLAAFLTALALVGGSGATSASAVEHAKVTLTLKSAKFDARWHVSKMSGHLMLTGIASGKMQVTVGWFPAQLFTNTPSFGPTAPITGSFTVGKGKFKKSLPARGLFPGNFELAGYGKNGSTIVSIPGRTVTLASPPEGVVGRTYISATPSGPAVKNLPARSKTIYAHYIWARYPAKPVIDQRWSGPSGPWGSSYTVARGVFIAYAFAKGKTLPRGTYHHVLRVLGRPVAEVSAQVG